MNAMETAAYCLAYRLAIAKETEEGKITDRLKEIRHRDQIGIPKKIFETSNFIQQEPDISFTFYLGSPL